MEPATNSHASISILFVEDDEIILGLQLALLRARFPDVLFHSAVNGKFGLDVFKVHTPDIVLTDINMSDMCGVQMSENIRSIKPDTKFIAITGKSGEFGKNEKNILRNSEGMNFQFDHVIVKPVDLSELFSSIEQCICEITQQVTPRDSTIP